MWFLTLAAFAFDDQVCTEPPTGPPKGARTLAASALPRVHELRRQVFLGNAVHPSPEMTDWLRVQLPAPEPGSLTLAAHTALDPEGGGWLLLEARAPVRPAFLPVNLTWVVDLSKPMDSVLTRAIPVLEDTPASYRPRSVTRLQLARASMHQLVDHLPEGSRVSIVGYDGRHARVLLEPSSDRIEMGRTIEHLVHGVVSDADPDTADTLERVGTEIFTPCADNRAWVFTSRASDEVREALLGVVDRWKSPDMERWTFAFGDQKPADAQTLLLSTERTATQVVNSLSDTEVIWPALLEAGGVSARDVKLQLTLDGAEEELSVGDMTSGRGWAQLRHVEDAATLVGTFRVTDADLQVEFLEPGPLGDAAPSLRNRVALERWNADSIGQMPSRGQGAELGAWMQTSVGTPPEDAAPWVAENASIEPYGEGWDVVVEVLASGPLDPENLRLRGAPPLAWTQRDDRSFVVWSLQAPVDQAALDGVAPLPLAHHRRRSDRIRTLHGLRTGNGVEPVHGTQGELAAVLAQRAWAAGELEAAVGLAKGCLDAAHPGVMLPCTTVAGRALLDAGRPEEARALVVRGLRRFPASSALQLLRGETAVRLGEVSQAQAAFLTAMKTGVHAGVPARALAKLMEAERQHTLAAMAWTHLLLHDPDDNEARSRLHALLRLKKWRRAPRLGDLGRVTLPEGSLVQRLETLMGRWSQATLADRQTYGNRLWYRVMGRFYTQLARETMFQEAAHRALVPPGKISPRVEKRVRAVGSLLRKLDTLRQERDVVPTTEGLLSTPRAP